jgi:hypothetical protein
VFSIYGHFPKLDVAGSTPVSRSKKSGLYANDGSNPDPEADF